MTLRHVVAVSAAMNSEESVRWDALSELLGRLLAALVLAGALSWTSAAFAVEPVDFRFEVRPILSRNCFSCHGPDESHREADLRLDVRDVPIEFGAIVSGEPDESELIRRITSADASEQMPPAESGHRLSAAEISTLKQWIVEGAKYSRHWSYEPPARAPRPSVSDPSWCRNDIDYFILAKLDNNNLSPAQEADRPRLIRRLTLDLIGLPPTPIEVDDFVNDNGPDAYERLVDRLLRSPAYGEHFASKWLDLARYADTNGYEQDRRRTMWPYRDWVVGALNRDMPFDEFTIEQIAGDLLADPSREQLVATAFHRNTMQNDEGGTDDEEFRVAAVVDRLNTTMQVWMGTTIGCCQCHTHKYDPIAHREYYELFAFFNQTQDADRTDQLPTLASVLAKRPAPAAASLVVAASAAAPTKQTSFSALDDNVLVMQELPVSEQRQTHIHIRGNFLDKGEAVTPNTPSAFPPMANEAPRNRLGLARWLVDRKNPLTARVVVNRQWESLIGAGIVRTCEDFGSQGDLPSHPQLLDSLAVDFMEEGWSLKRLTKTIVMSATYRQSAVTSLEKRERDPENRLLSRGPRYRLTAEQIRDQALAVSGLLSHKMGGPSVMPRQPDGIWQMVYSADNWQTSPNEDRYRRGLYTFWRRTSPYPSAMALDATSRETCTIRRIPTNTPVAAFALLNDPVYVEAAQSLARRIVEFGGQDVEAGAHYAFHRVLARDATDVECRRLVDLFQSESEYYRAHPADARKLTSTDEATRPDDRVADLAAWTVVSNVLLNLDETLTQ